MTRKGLVSLFFVSFSFGILTTSCVDEIFPEFEEFENALVVDGSITNQPGPYQVKLSTSSALNKAESNPVEGAAVSIIEEGGETETLIEVAPGQYETSEAGIRGIPGRKYKLAILTSGGKNYESPFQELQEPTPIDTVVAEVEYVYYPAEDRELPGYKFYLEGGQVQYEKDYYLWTYKETYQYESDYDIHFVYDNNQESPFDDPKAYRTCWRTYVVNDLAVYSTLGLTEKRIENFPLNFVRADDKRLSIRYSLLLKQFTISEDAFTFWQGIESQVSDLSSLYTTQPYQLRGNVKNMEDGDEPVMGFFMVAGLSEKRVFVNPPPGIEVSYPICGLDFMGYRWIFWTPPSEWPIYIHEPTAGGKAISGTGCMDCREVGGVIEKPDFWR